MYPSKPAKALFLIANHIIAAHIPLHEIHPAQLFGGSKPDNDTDGLLLRRANTKLGSQNIWVAQICCTVDCPKGQIQDPHDCLECTKCGAGQKPDPEQRKCIKDDCAVCPKDQVRDKSDCSKCNTCGPGERPDAQQKACLKDDCANCGAGEIRDPKNCRKCIDKRKRFEDKRKRVTELRSQKIRDLLRDAKGKLFEKKKAKMQERHRDKAPRRKQSKLRRMGRCATLVPLVMGGAYANEVDNLFDQEFVESDQMMEFWPEGMSVKEVDNWVDEGTDSFFESEDYQYKWIEKGREKSDITIESQYVSPSGMGGGVKVNKRDGDNTVAGIPTTNELVVRSSGEARSSRHEENVPSMFRRHDYNPESPPTTTTDLVVHSPHPTTTALTTHLQVRCLPFCLIPIFQAIMALLRVFSGVAVRIGLRVAGRALQSGIRVSKARNAIPKAKQFSKGKEISKDANWKRCLQGLDPW